MSSPPRAGLQVCACALALAACVTQPTYYQAAARPNAVGHSEQRIEAGRYRITFRGGPDAPASQVSNHVLLRAADLALAEGNDWFQVSDRRLQQAPGGGGPSLAATIEVAMGRGDRPLGADVYDARALRRTLGPRS